MSLLLGEYLGRTVDVLAWRGGKPLGVQQLAPNLADESSSGEICTGVQKLAQRVITELLTPRGSMRYQPLRGTDLIPKLQRGQLRTEGDVQAAFVLAELQMRANLQAEESASDPSDERYSSVKLTEISLQPGYARLTIELRNAAGGGSVFIVPIPVVL